jgi:hypothetical protein
MGMSERGKLALSYAQRGWKIFPVEEGTKDSPRVRWGSQATDDSETVRKWWEKWPNDNIALACGHSNITVVDLDDKKGKRGTKEWNGLLLDNGWDGEPHAAREFAAADFGEELDFLAEFEGKTLDEAAKVVIAKHGVGLTKAKNMIKDALSESNGSKKRLSDGRGIWLDRVNPKNSRSGLIVRVGAA